ncbi:unnamed protein product [Trichobilharzia regenti]|nr:unnamed protein product [Trichobilharzia regenti]
MLIISDLLALSMSIWIVISSRRRQLRHGTQATIRT